MAALRVEESPSKISRQTGKPAHWVDAAGSSFDNPWPSWRATSTFELIALVLHLSKNSPAPSAHAVREELPIRTPTWGLEDESKDKAQRSIKTTWLGHACFLVEFPSRQPGSRGIRVLFDPVFSDRCSPISWMGPKRFTPPPCKVDEIPDIDAIVISHNHYDHMDSHTLQTLYSRSPNRPPQLFAPLGNAPHLKSMGIPESATHIMDWWDSKRLTIEINSSADTSSLSVDLTCTPCQHFAGRALTDKFKTLWSSWVIEDVISPATAPPAQVSPLKLFFGGDTGYRAVLDGQNEDDVPVCPVFKEIGQVFNGFDIALIPIGAYLPRQFMSPIHCAPQDSVRLFKDVKAKKAIGMHWATWVLTSEDFFEPPRRLAEECGKIGIPEGDFTVCEIGETRFFF